MLAEPRALACSGHGVPLVADAAGIQPQRPRGRGLGPQRRNFRRDEAGLEIVGEKSAFGEEARLRIRIPAGPATAPAPSHRTRHPTSAAARRCRNRAPPSFSNADSAACSRKISAAELKSNAAPKPSRLATSPMIHQSGLASPGAAQERALPRDPPLRIGHGAGFLAPGLRRQQHMRARIDRVVGNHVLGNHEQFEFLQRLADGVGVRQRHRRIGAHHPQRLDLAARDRLEHLHRLQPLMGGDARRLPEPAHAVDVRRREIPYARRAGWRARRPRGRPSHWAARSARTATRPPCRSAPSRGGN